MMAASLALPVMPVSLDAVSRMDLSATPWRRIDLSERDGIWCLVDADDYGWLSEHKWNVWHSGRSRWQLYAKRNVGPGRATVRMHREIQLKAEPRDDAGSLFVDHGNGCTLDNRKANFKWVTPTQNRANTRAQGHAPSVEFVLYRLLQKHQAEIQQLAGIPF